MQFVWSYDERVSQIPLQSDRGMPRTSANNIAVTIMEGLDIHIQVSLGSYVCRNKHGYSPEERSRIARQRVNGGQAVDHDRRNKGRKMDEQTRGKRFQDTSR